MVRLLRLLLKSAREEHPSFNPTMVRLLHGKEYVVFLPVWGFNPTMVRLLPGAVPALAEGTASFNPTMVRLLRATRFRVPHIPSRFNPTMVRLLLVTPPRAAKSVRVSIPLWCDCYPSIHH